jgi:hypothetical protein
MRPKAPIEHLDISIYEVPTDAPEVFGIML